MKILYATSEALPFMASGGLADVAGSLPRAIRNRQHACRVVMPLYGDISEEMRESMKFVVSFDVTLAWRKQYCGVFEATANGVKYYLLDNEYYFKRKGIYGFFDDAERFAFFSKAVLEMVNYIDYEPDIINANDWQCSMIPVFLNLFYRHIEKYQMIKTVFTIHNIQYQGKYGMNVANDVLGIPYYAAGIVEYDGCLNMMKGAIDQCDMVTTVSPTYAKEILDPWFSHGMDRLLCEKQHKLMGILNGIDYDVYNPATDSMLYANYTAENIEKKIENKNALQREVGLEINNDKLLVGIVTRLVSHKGLDLIKYIFDEIIANGMQVVILGAGDWLYEEFFNEMRERYPGDVSVTLGFIPELARKIYAGSDVFLMPSKSEPCGLAQMVSLRYGTIPIVRETGGLKDSIIDQDEPNGNGYTFKTYNAHDMLSSILRAKEDFLNKEKWNKIMTNAMGCDFSWSRSAGEYIKMYKNIIEK